MKILIVEDDEFKASDILKAISDLNLELDFDRAASVTSALRLISGEVFEIVILDMSLPTFDLSGPGGGGSPQGQGGVEVLRLAARLAKAPAFIVATQYPDIEVEGEELPLRSVSAKLTQRFGLEVIDCLLYEFDGVTWKDPLRRHIAQLASR